MTINEIITERITSKPTFTYNFGTYPLDTTDVWNITGILSMRGGVTASYLGNTIYITPKQIYYDIEDTVQIELNNTSLYTTDCRRKLIEFNITVKFLYANYITLKSSNNNGTGNTWVQFDSSYGSLIKYNISDPSTFITKSDFTDVGTEIIYIPDGKELHLFSDDVTAYNGDNPITIFSSPNKMNMTGDIRYMLARSSIKLDNGGITEIKVPYAFKGMFKNQTHLKSALTPKTMSNSETVLLSEGCYESMYEGCTGITNTNEAKFYTTIIQPYSCKNMFKGCTGITNHTRIGGKQVSTDPSTYVQAVETGGLSGMFEGCTSLTSTGYMYLKNPRVEDYGMQNMFKDCTSIVYTDINVRNVYTGNRWSFAGLFAGCTSLPGNQLDQSIPVFYSMLSCKEHCFDGIFKGCTSFTGLTNGSGKGIAYSPWPYLESYAAYSFFEAFKDCTSLKKIPVMNYEDLYEHSFDSAYKNCTSLTSVNFSDSDDYFCRIMGYALDYACQEMFMGCTNITSVMMPHFDRSSSTGLCKNMFKGCSSLSTVYNPQYGLGGRAGISTMYEGWLDGVAASGTYYFNEWFWKSKSSAYYGLSDSAKLAAIREDFHIPSGWTIVRFTPTYKQEYN